MAYNIGIIGDTDYIAGRFAEAAMKAGNGVSDQIYAAYEDSKLNMKPGDTVPAPITRADKLPEPYRSNALRARREAMEAIDRLQEECEAEVRRSMVGDVPPEAARVLQTWANRSKVSDAELRGMAEQYGSSYPVVQAVNETAERMGSKLRAAYPGETMLERIGQAADHARYIARQDAGQMLDSTARSFGQAFTADAIKKCKGTCKGYLDGTTEGMDAMSALIPKQFKPMDEGAVYEVDIEGNAEPGSVQQAVTAAPGGNE